MAKKPQKPRRGSRTLRASLMLGLSTPVLMLATSQGGCSKHEPAEVRNCDIPALFASSCNGSTCHGSESPRADLDLVSPGVDQRLFHVLSSEDCGERKLIVPGHPEQSLLFNKITESKPLCGKRMPQRNQLSSTEVACLKDYIERAGTDVDVADCETCGTILCVDQMRDPEHCGGCGMACETGKICAEGSCINPCDAGDTLCGASCVDLNQSENHCGSCGHRCGPGSACQAGVCTCQAPGGGVGGAGGASVIPTEPVSFKDDLLPLFDNSCSGSDCHTEADREAPLGLDPSEAYAHLVGVDADGCDGRKLVIPSDPDKSYILEKLLGGAVCDGGQMPLASDPLPDAATAKFVSWICAGAPDN